MKNFKKIMCLSMAVAMVASMAVSASAATLPTYSNDNQMEAFADGATSGDKTIPVTLSADATVFDVTVPTAFPIVIDPDTGVPTTADDVKITNDSYGQIVVAKIVAKDNAAEGVDADWHLAAFDTDMSKEKVDVNKIGLMVQPTGGAAAAAGGTELKTDDSNAALQTLLPEAKAEWLMNGVTAADESNVLGIKYSANSSAVSAAITNKVVANIVITIAWNQEGTIAG